MKYLCSPPVFKYHLIAFLYFGWHIFPFPMGEIPYVGDFLNSWEDKIWVVIANWVGRLVFGIPSISYNFNGSGDTTFNWVVEFTELMLSILGCLVWSVVDRARVGYARLGHWMEVYIRYYLGFTMLSYGFAKVFPLQFGTITSYRLHEQLGDMSPMGLLWTFMAYSKSYQLFSGLAEVVAGCLLFFRKTQMLGALISVGVMLNIFMLNMCYDVPVKLYSFNLMLMGIYVANADLKRLIGFFIQNQPTASRAFFQPFQGTKWYKWVRIAIKVIFFAYVFYGFVYKNLAENAKVEAPLAAFYGPYTVTKFVKNGVEGVDGDSTRWEKLFIDRRGSYDMIYVSNEMNLRKRINFDKNDSTRTFTFTALLDTNKYVMHYSQPDSNSLIMNGVFQKDSLYLELTQMKKKDFLLVRRGFHWVNEVSFNK